MATKPNFLIKLAASVALISLLVACGDDKEQAVKSYESVNACQADIASDATSEERDKIKKDCETAQEKSVVEHERTVTRYVTVDKCSELYDNCRRASDGNGYVPAMTGFMLGYMMGGGGQPVYHPYYRDRWYNSYSGGTNLGYYRNGYIVASPRSTWTQSYSSVPVAKGSPPPVVTRGGFGGSAAAAAGRPVFSSPSSSGRSGSVLAPAAASSRGGFGGSAAAASSSSSG